MNSGKIKYVVLVLTVISLLIFTACTATNKPDGQETGNQDELQEQKEKFTIYEKYGLAISIPNDIIDDVIIVTDPEWETYEDTYLISVYEKRSFEEAKKKYPDGYAGYIFSIVRYNKAQYEQFLCSDGSGQSFFARDDNYYYGWFIPTDVQFYHEDGLDEQSDEWKSWIELNEKCIAIKDDFVTRNDLEPYSDREFWDREYTYDSNHIFVDYYPYYEYNGSRDEVWTLILSQPAEQGIDGIWCVERWKDQYGYVYPYFPDKNGISSDEYYTMLQEECKAGKNLDRLEPERVALDFVKSLFGHDKATLRSFLPSGSVPESPGFYSVSTGNLHDYMQKILAGEYVSAYKLLPCLENFTYDTWQEFEKTYGKNTTWWNSLWAALNSAAVSDVYDDGTDQVYRDYYIGKAFLTSDGAYAEGLSDIVMRQWEQNRTFYSTALIEKFSDEEENVIRQHICYMMGHGKNQSELFGLFIPESGLSIYLTTYPVDFPFGCSLIEKSREHFVAESFGKGFIIESDSLNVTILNPYEGVYTVTTIRTEKEGYAAAGVAVGDTEEKLLDHWTKNLKEKLRKLDSISYDDEAWFSEYDRAYSFTPKDSTKSVVYLIRNGKVSGIELINGLDGSMY